MAPARLRERRDLDALRTGRVVAEDGARRRLRLRASGQLVLTVTVGRLDEHGWRDGVVDRRGVAHDGRVLHPRIVEAGDGAVEDLAALHPGGVLGAHAEFLRRLIVDASRWLPRQHAFLRPRDLVVVVLCGGDVGDVGQRVQLQDVQARLVEAAGRDAADHSPVPETRRLIRGRAAPVSRGSLT